MSDAEEEQDKSDLTLLLIAMIASAALMLVLAMIGLPNLGLVPLAMSAAGASLYLLRATRP